MAGKNESKVESVRSLSEFFTDAGKRLRRPKANLEEYVREKMD